MTESSSNETQLSLFDSGPFPHIQKPLQLLQPTGRATSFKVAVVLLLGWVPLVLLVILQGLTRHNHPLASFFTDFGVHARSLLAAPLFFVAEAICLPRLGKIVQHFVAADLIATRDRARFDAIVAATGRHLNSTVAEVLAVLLTYSLIALLIHFLPPSTFPLWYSPSQRGYPHLSWAGWWYAAVSLPLLLMILLGWVWRILLWSWFLFRVSRMSLHLIPAHPDLAGGLKFLDLSLLAFMPVGFTVGIIAAGSVANKVVVGRVSLLAFQKPMLALLVVIVIFFVGPLLVFVTSLREHIRRGVFQYGVLVHGVGEQFEKKWCGGAAIGEDALSAPDFSATTDLYAIAANVNQMRGFPFGLKSVIGLIVATMLPFLPVALMAIPLEVILKEVAAVLF